MSTRSLTFLLLGKDEASPAFLKLSESMNKTSVAATKAQGSILGFSKKTAAGLTALAAVDIAGHMAKQASSFQSAMTKIQTQAGASAGEVRTMSAAVLALSGKVATAPQDLAKSLYLVESAGYRGSTALKDLTAAAKLSKIGGADLTETTDALVGVLQTGIVTGANAAGKTVAELNSIIGAGKMRMDDLNEALGTGILASAKSFGVSLQSVGAALALMTDQGTPAASAATHLRMAMSLLAAPSKQSASFLEKVGVSSADAGREVSATQTLLEKSGVKSLQLAADLRKPDGFLVALTDLKNHMKSAGLSASESSALLSRAFGGGRSSGPILQMLANLDLLKEKYKEIGSGAAKFGADWAATQHTAEYAFSGVKSSLDVISIELGDRILPLFSKTATFARPAPSAQPCRHRGTCCSRVSTSQVRRCRRSAAR